MKQLTQKQLINKFNELSDEEILFSIQKFIKDEDFIFDFIDNIVYDYYDEEDKILRLDVFLDVIELSIKSKPSEAHYENVVSLIEAYESQLFENNNYIDKLNTIFVNNNYVIYKKINTFSSIKKDLSKKSLNSFEYLNIANLIILEHKEDIKMFQLILDHNFINQYINNLINNLLYSRNITFLELAFKKLKKLNNLNIIE